MRAAFASVLLYPMDRRHEIANQTLGYCYSVICTLTSTPVVATPAPVVVQPDPKPKELPTLRLSESSDLLPSFGLSSSSSSPTLPWGTAEDLPNRVREGHSQNVPGEGSLFNVSTLSPELVVRATREGGAATSEGVLLPTMLEDFDDSVLGDPSNGRECHSYSDTPSKVGQGCRP